MEKLVTFCRTQLKGRILFKRVEAFKEIPITDVVCKPITSKEVIYDFLKRMDMFLYCCEEITYLYFFYEENGQINAVCYDNYYGSTTITEIQDIMELKTCNWGIVNVFEPSNFCN